MHNITVRENGEEFYFASLDGKKYLEVTRPCTDDDSADLKALFAGNGRTKPMTYARRWFSLKPSTVVFDSDALSDDTDMLNRFAQKFMPH